MILVEETTVPRDGIKQLTANNVDMCRPPKNSSGCYSTNFFVYSIGYNKICGKIKGYQKGAPDAFRQSTSLIESS